MTVLGGRRLLAAGLMVLVGSLLLLTACGEGEEAPTSDGDERDASAAEFEDLPTVEFPVRWATAIAADLPTLVRSADVIFTAEVTGLQGQRLREFSPSEASGSSPDAADAVSPSSGGASFPISLFEVRVERSMAGELSAGSTVVIQQAGGVSKRPDGSNVRFILEGDEPLEVGSTYLFFATLAPDGTLGAPPFGRLRIGTAGALEPVGTFSNLGALKQLNNMRLEDAAREVDAASAR